MFIQGTVEMPMSIYIYIYISELLRGYKKI